MTPESDEDLRKIVAACLSTPGPGKVAAVERACADHPELQREIRETMAAITELKMTAHQVGPRSPAIPSAGRRVGRFTLTAEIGRGGMGVVYRARDELMGRDVALKMIPQGTVAGSDGTRGFRREVQALARLSHPHIVGIYEPGVTDEGVPYFVMDFVDGESLTDLLRRAQGVPRVQRTRGTLRPSGTGEGKGSYVEAAVMLAAKIARALHHAHARGLIHRDVKPGNILVDRQGEPRLVDFGVAKMIDTQTATVGGPGTLHYLAPEQIAGDGPVNASSDVYALGVTLYEMLALRQPFQGATRTQVHHRILHEEPTRLRRLDPSIHVDVETVCAKAMEKEPGRRYASAAAFADDLDNLLTLRPISARPASLVVRALKLARRRPAQTIAALASPVLVVLAAVIIQRATADARRDRAEQLFERACDYFASGASTQAESALTDALVANPGHVLALRLRQHVGQSARQRSHEGSLWSMRPWVVDPASTLSSEAFRAKWAQLDEWLLAAGSSDGQNDVARCLWATQHRDMPAPDRNAVTTTAGPGTIVCNGPAGVDIHLFRHEPLPDSGRLVPVPVQSKPWMPSCRPGSVALAVAAVVPGSPAAVAGIQNGDHILGIDSAPIERALFVVATSARTPDGIRPGDRIVELDGQPIGGEMELLDAWDLHRGKPVCDALIGRGSSRTLLHVARSGTPEAAFGCEFGAAERCFEANLAFGPARLEVLHGEIVREVSLPVGSTAGMIVRQTAYPLFTSVANRLGTLPLEPRALPAGSYLLLCRADGHEDLRVPVLVTAGGTIEVAADLLPAGTTPPGFCYVAPGWFLVGGDEQAPAIARFRGDADARQRWTDGFWISRREVCAGEYLEFVNDPQTLQKIEQSRAKNDLRFVPRQLILDSPDMPISKPLWLKTGGSYGLGSWNPRWPVRGVSCEDADEYCRWLNARQQIQADGTRWTYRLPLVDEWEKAARGADGRTYVWGETIAAGSSHWYRRIDARTRTSDGVLPWDLPLQFPADESPYGVGDMAGSLMEWCAGTEHLPWMRVWRGGYASGRGGSPEDPASRDLRVAAKHFGYPWRVGENDGFRLVARRVQARR